MKVLITMAGKGQRFRDAGYDCPKYMIGALGKSLFEWSMLSLIDFFANEFIFITRYEDDPSRFIAEKCELLGINDFKIIPLAATTDGQATTVLMAGDYINDNEAFLVYNIDTYVNEYSIRSEEMKGDGFIPGFIAEGSKWSFISMDEGFRVLDIAEKVPISDIATLGLYYFNSFSAYKEDYKKTFDNNANLVNGEKYIAPIYKTMINMNKPVYGSVVPAQQVWGLGTPSDLLYFLDNYESR